MKTKKWFRRFFAGMGIGAGAAIPGVSGSAVAVVFKVFESIIWAVNNIRKHFGRAFAILFPIIFGIICAVIPCIWLFKMALEHFVFGIICIFAGFLIGSFPGVTDEIKGVKVTKKYILSAVIGALVVIGMGAISVFFGGKMNVATHFGEMSWWFILILILVGIIAAVALIVPGMSGSLILLILGFYKPLVDNTVLWVKEMLMSGDFSNTWKLFVMLLAFAVGVLIGVIITSKMMKFFLGRYHNGTYFAIVGFVIGSILVIFFNSIIFNYYLVWGGQNITGFSPSLPMAVEIPLGIGLLAVCAFLSYLLVRFGRKNGKEEEKYDMGA
ncbi:MAG: DUF368 domain-containing protein [Erysipelotrichaceae bacterium]|jgi:putative membrane protein|nr:DUF368 domain-containing protein [Bacilli bacterium]NLV29199.1 DUF368 domain-containing protein [Erysipelotrichaceae bacterium]